MKIKDGSFVVIFKDDTRKEIFLVYRSDWPIWNLTGGGIEIGEDPKSAAIRETFEEAHFKIKIVRKVGRYKYIQPNKNTFINHSHLFEGRYISGEFAPEFPGCRGRWFNVHNLPIDITDMTKMRIMDTVNFNGNEFQKTVYRAQLKDNLHLFFRHPISALKYFSQK